MIYNVAGLLMDTEGSARRFEVDGEELYTDRHHFRDISGPVRMLRTDRTILVSASLSARAVDTCSRCLEPATLDVSVEFEEEFQPFNFDLMGERPAPVEPEYDPALIIDERNILDLSDALAQAFSMAVPIAPLCQPECKGLCKTCFTNRNFAECRCDQNPIDPRWQKLAELTSKTPNSMN